MASQCQGVYGYMAKFCGHSETPAPLAGVSTADRVCLTLIERDGCGIRKKCAHAAPDPRAGDVAAASLLIGSRPRN